MSTINASESYTNIVKIINSAENIANETQNKLNQLGKMIYPQEKDSIYVYTSILYANSTRLEKRVNVLSGKIKGKCLVVTIELISFVQLYLNTEVRN